MIVNGRHPVHILLIAVVVAVAISIGNGSIARAPVSNVDDLIALSSLKGDMARTEYGVQQQSRLHFDLHDFGSWDPCRKFTEDVEHALCADISKDVNSRLGGRTPKNTWINKMFTNVFGTFSQRDCWKSLSDEIDGRCIRSTTALDEYLALHRDISRCMHETDENKYSFTDDPAADAPYKALKVFLVVHHMISNVCSNRFIVDIHRHTTEMHDMVRKGFAESRRKLVTVEKRLVSAQASMDKCMVNSEAYRDDCETKTHDAHGRLETLSVELAAAEAKNDGMRSVLIDRASRIHDLEREAKIREDEINSLQYKIGKLGESVTAKILRWLDDKMEPVYGRVIQTIPVCVVVMLVSLITYLMMWSRKNDVDRSSDDRKHERMCIECNIRPPREGVRTKKCVECLRGRRRDDASV